MRQSPSSLTGRLRRASLGIKLAALGALVTAAVVFVAFWALSLEIRANTRAELVSQLSHNQRTLQQLQTRDASQLLFAASLVAQLPRLQYDLAIYRDDADSAAAERAQAVNTVEDELRNRLHDVEANLLVVTDDSGRVFARASDAGAPLERGARLASLAAVRDVLDPNAPTDLGDQGVLRTAVGSFEIAAYPLVQGGITLGALVMGRRLDAAFIDAAHKAADGAVVLTAGHSVVGASDSALASPAIARALARLSTRSDPMAASLDGREYVVAPVPLGQTQAQETVVLWMLEPLSPRVAAVMRPLRADFLFYGSLAVLVAAIGAVFVARSVLRPFHRFVRYMRSGPAALERQARFDATREAIEVRTLNDSFNDLMDSLAVKRRELEERTAELVAANVVLTDEISERTRVERALRESEAQLRQSQKLEAIGTLAGGIAHDFNNLITVISGYTQLALMRADRASPVAEDLRQVIEASDRAANLTHQLLAFSRKQVLQPTVLDLGEVVSGIGPMLRRIIGEHIELRIAGDSPLARVRADRGQLEQVLLNLAVNARDAMTVGGGGGILTIETRNRDAAVCLIVADTGSGMPDDVKERVFEPFFTTKEPGKGTGLGLSTVYGIVNQSGGTIGVDSLLGKGTTFTIALPTVEAMTTAGVATVEEGDLPCGHETILIVEDAEDVRILARRTLEERGYAVLVARSASEALEIANARPIDVLLTDIVMPRTSGPQLAARYLQTRPSTVVIYMSGYADDALAQYELDPGSVFIRKPFTPAVLARTVREALDATSGVNASAAAD